jgi:hypothetical protein
VLIVTYESSYETSYRMYDDVCVPCDFVIQSCRYKVEQLNSVPRLMWANLIRYQRRRISMEETEGAEGWTDLADLSFLRTFYVKPRPHLNNTSVNNLTNVHTEI